MVDHKSGLTAINADVLAGDDNDFILKHISLPDLKIEDRFSVVRPARSHTQS